jgi:hypothetical protein
MYEVIIHRGLENYIPTTAAAAATTTTTKFFG